MILASVQTAQDTAPLSWGQVALAICAVAIVAAIYAIPAFMRARGALRDMPLPAEPTVPRQLTARNAPTLDAARRRVPSPRPGRGPSA